MMQVYIYTHTRIELLLDCFVAVITRRYFLSVVWSSCRTDSTRRRSSSPPFPRLCVPRYFTHIPRCNQNISYPRASHVFNKGGIDARSDACLAFILRLNIYSVILCSLLPIFFFFVLHNDGRENYTR